MKPCWSCGTEEPECYDPCECAKCVDPEDYQQWRDENQDEYEAWLDEQLDE